MIDIVVRATSNTIAQIVEDYFELPAIFSQDLDVDTEFQRTHEFAQTGPMVKFMDPELDGRALLLFNREPIQISQLGRKRRETAWMVSASDVSNAQVKEVVWAKITINYKIVSNIREVIEMFELFHAIKLERNTDIVVDILFEDALESIPLVYHTTANPITSFDLVGFEKHGMLWSADFSVDLEGLIFSPESFYYPRLLQTRTNFFVVNKDNIVYNLSNYIKTDVEDYVLNENGQVIRKETSNVDDSVLITSRFNLNEEG